MKEMSFAEFRAKLFAVLRSVERTREAILITRAGKPLAEIHSVPITAPQQERLRAEGDARDLQLINRYADVLNKDELDGLEHQTAKPSRSTARLVRKNKGRKRR
jgi:prevent-host-death family protein